MPVSAPVSARPGLPEVTAAGVTLASLVGVFSIPAEAGERPPDLLLALLVGWNAAWLLMVRRWPRPALLAVTASLVLYVLAGYPPGPTYAAGPLVLLLAGRGMGWRDRLLAGAGMVLALATGHLVSGDPGWVDMLARYVGWLAAAVLGAQVWRSADAGLAQRAQARALTEQRVRAEERLALARDLHDSVGHALSVIAIQTRVARAHLDPGPGADALDAVEQSTVAAMGDLRVLVGGLRAEGGSPTEPQAGIESIPDLVQRSEQAGMPVDLRCAPIAASRPVSAAAYRVVQEALTNARRHAPGARCEVELAEGHGEMRVVVRNAPGAAGPGAPGGGTGLVGLEERVVATGGRWTCGSTPDGGWEVRATWPSPSPS